MSKDIGLVPVVAGESGSCETSPLACPGEAVAPSGDLSLFRVSAPGTVAALRWTDLSSSAHARGLVIAVRICEQVPWTRVEGWLRDLVVRVADSPIVLWEECLSREDAITVFARAHLIGIRAHTSDPVMGFPRLRQDLTDAADFGKLLPIWLRNRGVLTSTAAADLIEQVVHIALRYRTLRDITKTLGLARRSVQSAFAHSGLGQAAAWLRLLRLVNVGLCLQSRPTEPIERIALECGFYDAAALRHRFRSTFGASPAEARVGVGWEWMMSAAWTRHRRRLSSTVSPSVRHHIG